MTTKILNESDIPEAVALLSQGEVIGFPTETVYGLAGMARHEGAIAQIFSLKKRPSDNPLIVHISDFSQLDEIAVVPESSWFFALARHFWPGPLTFVLPKRNYFPGYVTAGQAAIAVRMPSHPLALKLLHALKAPIAAPSANLSGRPSPTEVAHVLEDFEGQIPAILDGGPCSFGLESTVLSLLGPQPMLLRPGAISLQEIEALLKIRVERGSSEVTPLSPGQKYRHYAPQAQVHLVQRKEEIQGKEPFVLSKEPLANTAHRRLEPRFLYAHLREADRKGYGEIWILLDPLSEQDEALMDRVLRASGKVTGAGA